MTFLPSRMILAIAAVVDVALRAKKRPVCAKAIASHLGLSPRHFEPLLQALVHDGILRGIRGPGGGYVLGCDLNDLSVDRVVKSASGSDELAVLDVDVPSDFARLTVMPVISTAENAFATALERIRIAEIVAAAEQADRGHLQDDAARR